MRQPCLVIAFLNRLGVGEGEPALTIVTRPQDIPFRVSPNAPRDLEAWRQPWWGTKSYFVAVIKP